MYMYTNKLIPERLTKYTQYLSLIAPANHTHLHRCLPRKWPKTTRIRSLMIEKCIETLLYHNVPPAMYPVE